MIFWGEMYHGPERIKPERRTHAIAKGVVDMQAELEKLKLENVELKNKLEEYVGKIEGPEEKKV